MQRKKTWGGRRPGAGRKPLEGKAFEATILVRVSQEQKVYYQNRGSSKWFRQVINTEMNRELEQAAAASAHSPEESPSAPVPVAAQRRVAVPLETYSVQAGFPSPAESYKESLDFNDLLVDNEASTYVMRVAGQSMIDAGLDDGDLIVVDRSKKPVHGDIVVMRINNEFTLKRYMSRRGVIYLKAENSTGLYKDIYPSETDEWVCFGVVNYSIKKFCGKKAV